MASVTLEQVSKIYTEKGKSGNHAVKSVSMSIHDGEIVAILGSSGCGKTSMLRMIAGFESISAGSIRIGKQVVNKLAPRQRKVAMAFEGYALYPPLTVYDNIAFSLLLSNKTPDVKKRVLYMAELLEITDILDAYPPTLSGGQQQRVSLARALVRDTDLYLLDEPMSQLEPQLRAMLRGRIKEYLIEHQMTTVFVTHDQTEAVALSDRIAVMSHGVLQQFASPLELKERPANLFVASFIGEPAMNLFPAQLSLHDGYLTALVDAHSGSGEAFRASFGALERCPLATALPNGHAVYLGIRPQSVILKDCTDEPGRITGTLAFNQWQGDQSHIGVNLGGHTLLAVTDSAVGLSVKPTVAIDFPLSALHLFDKKSELALLHGAAIA